MIEPWILEGEAADAFLREMKRIDDLDPESDEAKQRKAHLDECSRVYRETMAKLGR